MPNAAFVFIFLGVLFSGMLAYEVSTVRQPLISPSTRPAASNRIVRPITNKPKPLNIFDSSKDKSSKNRNNRESGI